MPPRLRLALFALVACCAAAVVGVSLAADEGDGVDAGPTGFAGARRPPGAAAPGLALRDQDGRAVAMDELRGRPYVVTFVYSQCEETCPLQVQAIRGALDDLGRDVPVLGVSVDPAGDTPVRAKRFLSAQHMTGRMRFLLGTEAELAPVWRAYGIRPQRGALDHSSYVVLVDGRGFQRVGFPAQHLTEEDVAHDLRVLGA